MNKIKQILTLLFVCSGLLSITAQEKTYADRWAAKETKRYTENLSLSDEQAGKVHEILLTTAKKAEEIKEKETGEAQKKAIWRNTNERSKQLEAVFTPEQRKKFKEMQGGGKGGSTTSKQQQPEGSGSSDAYIERWVNERVSYYTSHLGLSAKQAQAFHEILLSTSKKAAEIKEKETGDAQKKALWRNNKDRKDQIMGSLNDDQKKKFEQLK